MMVMGQMAMMVATPGLFMFSKELAQLGHSNKKSQIKQLVLQL